MKLSKTSRVLAMALVLAILLPFPPAATVRVSNDKAALMLLQTRPQRRRESKKSPRITTLRIRAHNSEF